MLSMNEFGNLVKAYRKQRGWTQEELAEHWGFSRAYVSQIEAGKRKIDSASQVVRLADILDIPSEKLEAIGRGIPKRQSKEQNTSQDNDALFQMLLAPGRDMVRLSYLVWVADQHPVIEENLRTLIFNLETALVSYRGEFMQPARQLLAYAHQMLGKLAFDRLDYAAAGGHFSEMIDLGQDLNDADIIATGMIHQGSILRKRGRYESAVRCFTAARPFSQVASSGVHGTHYTRLARVYYDFGDEEHFRQAIETALYIASDMKESIESLANEFSLDDVLCEQASGFSELGKPEKALEIYQQTDRLRPFRSLRERGSYIINKAQAYLQIEDLDQGLKYALRGLQLATEYQSRRQIGWLDKSYARLSIKAIGKEKRLLTLRDALSEAHQKQKTW